MKSPTNEIPRSVLVADPDSKFLDSLALDDQNTLLPMRGVTAVKEAQLALADRAFRFIATVINPAIDGANGISLIRFARVHRPATPLFMVYDGDSPFSEKDQNILGIRGILKKPISYAQIVDQVAPNVVTFDPKTPSPEELATIGQ